MAEFPQGTVAFLFTDVEGSTRLWQAHPEAMQQAYARHDALLRDAVAAQGGVIYKVIGDALQAAFPTAPQALAAALAAQLALTAEAWSRHGLPAPLRVRMALHVGAVDPDPAGDYRSPVLNRLGRLLGATHGGQLLLSHAVYELVRDHLPPGADLLDLGVQHLRDLGRPERVWQLLHPALPAAFPPLPTLARPPTNLPLPPTPLVGRVGELARLQALLTQPHTRLVTLTGPGGVGKTRLALAAGAELRAGVPDGVWFVDLAPLRDPALVPAAIATVLGVREGGGQPLGVRLGAYLRERTLLLLLDNVEQVVAAAPLVAELLAGAPGLRVLATSRVRLALRGEQVLELTPLAVPDPRRLPDLAGLSQFAAVQLFLARASEVRPDLTVDATTAPIIAELCHRLDGLPLALELAAARLRLFAPAQLLARLERRLPFLTGGARDLPARQRTLRDAIAWSVELLTPAEQGLFRRLAVFAGGWTVAAAEAVCDPAGELEGLEGLTALVEQSLVRPPAEAMPAEAAAAAAAGPAAASGEPRLGMLAMIQEYAAEQLEASGEEDALRARHAAFFLDLAERAAPQLRGREQHGWLGDLEAEHDNLRAALTWVIARGESDPALRLATALFGFWETRGHYTEGRTWLERALAIGAGAPPALRAQAMLRAGILAGRQGDLTRARELLETSLALRREFGDEHGVAVTLTNLGNIARAEGEVDRAIALHEEALAYFRQTGEPRQTAGPLNNLANLVHEQGDLERAEALFTEALTHYRQAGDQVGEAIALHNLGKLVEDQGDVARAATLCGEALRLRQALGDQRGIASSLEALAGIARAIMPERAVRIYGAGTALRRRLGTPLPPREQDERDRKYAALRERLGDEVFAREWEVGDTRPTAESIAEALTLARELAAGEGA